MTTTRERCEHGMELCSLYGHHVHPCDVGRSGYADDFPHHIDGTPCLPAKAQADGGGYHVVKSGGLKVTFPDITQCATCGSVDGVPRMVHAQSCIHKDYPAPMNCYCGRQPCPTCTAKQAPGQGVLKPRSPGFLAEDKIDHASEQFDYIRELHGWLWQFVRSVLREDAGGNLGAFVPVALKEAKNLKARAEAAEKKLAQIKETAND